MAAKYKNLKKRIEEYFNMCDSLNFGEKTVVKPYTVSGLLDYLGISRAELESLRKKKYYEDTVTAALAKIEAFIEENALNSRLSCNASANSLKFNFGWGEKQNDVQDNESKSIKVILESSAEDYAG